MIRVPCRSPHCPAPRYVPVYRVGGKRVRCRFVFCEEHVREILDSQWLSCPVCASCGIGGCCSHWCPVCERHHDKEIEP